MLTRDELVESASGTVEVPHSHRLSDQAERVVGAHRDRRGVPRAESLPGTVGRHLKRALEDLVALGLSGVTMRRWREGICRQRPLHLDVFAVRLLIRTDHEVLAKSVRHHVSIACAWHAASLAFHVELSSALDEKREGALRESGGSGAGAGRSCRSSRKGAITAR